MGINLTQEQINELAEAKIASLENDLLQEKANLEKRYEAKKAAIYNELRNKIIEYDDLITTNEIDKKKALKKQSNKKSNKSLEELHRLLNDNVTIDQIAQETGYSMQYVRREMTRLKNKISNK